MLVDAYAPETGDKQAHFGKLIGTNRWTVGRWVAGKRPPGRAFAQAIADLTGLNAGLFGRAAAEPADLQDSLDRIEAALTDIRNDGANVEAEARAERMLNLVAEQLQAQSQLLEQLARVAARLEALVPVAQKPA